MLSHAERGPRAAALGAVVAMSVLLCAVWAGVASAAKPSAGTGVLEICKDGSNGAAGTTFYFTVQSSNGSAPAGETPVVGGTCQSLNLNAGKYTVGEDLGSPGGWNVASLTVDPDSADIGTNGPNLKAGTVKVQITQGSDVTVSYTNQQAASTLKICKWSAAAQLQGSQYSFTVGRQTVTAVAGKAPGDGTCSSLLAVQQGSKIKVSEAVPSGEAVASITTSPASILVSQNGATATVKVGAGANVVTYEDEPVAPPKTGFIEICKDAYDGYVNGSFHFEVTDTHGTNLDVHADSSTGEDVLVGQCSAPIQVPVGTAVVTESSSDQTQLEAVWASPGSDLGLVNLTNQTAKVVVPVAADSTGEVQVHFVNQTLTATLKVCNFLVASAGLAGQAFTYTVTDDQLLSANGSPVEITLSIVASAGANGACKVVTDPLGHPVLFPVGSHVTAVEDLSGYPFVSGDGGPFGADDTQATTIVSGINSISFANQGLLGF